jgi:hypothetical protein
MSHQKLVKSFLDQRARTYSLSFLLLLDFLIRLIISLIKKIKIGVYFDIIYFITK